MTAKNVESRLTKSCSKNESGAPF